MTTQAIMTKNVMKEQLITTKFDLLIIGGGITGVGIALDAATRGLKVALIEMNDFASGTSSRSTKLVHGGLRYLKQFEIKEVAELGKERAIVYENAPHVTTPVRMLLPFHQGGTFGKFTTNIGLRVYDFLAAVKKSERRTMLNAVETLKKEPLIKKQQLKGGGVYVEYRTDDARLTIEVAKTAINYGAILSNYTKFTEFLYNKDGQINGVRAIDTLLNEELMISAKKVINAAGPWVDDVRSVEGQTAGKHLILTKGVHLVFDQSKFPLKQAVYFDTPDKRMVFAIPREGKTYVGTTDTFYEGNPKDMDITSEDRTYILDTIRFMFPTVNLLESDVESSWAGVRPLIHEEGKGPSEISRHDEVWQSDTGLITIAGGKLTGYRKMAEKVLNDLAPTLKEQFGMKSKECVTKQLKLSGGDVGGSHNLQQYTKQQIEAALKLGLDEADASFIAQQYGSNASKVLSYVKQAPSTLPASLYAQLCYAIDEEFVQHPNDFFIRRTGAMFFNIGLVREYQSAVMAIMAEKLSWSDKQFEQFSADVQEEIARATTVR